MNKTDVLSKISPQMKAVLAKEDEIAGEGLYATDVGFAKMRENYVRARAYWNEGGPKMASTRDVDVPVEGGNVHVRLYRPTDAEGLPAIVFVHGGGFVEGSPDTHDRITRKLAAASGALVASVDYSLSPEAKFPRALDECTGVVRRVHEAPDEFGVDGDDVSLAGDSGGANLAMGTYLRLRDEDGGVPFVTSLLLYYGMFGLADSMSQRLFGGPFDGMEKKDLDYYEDCYLARPADAESPYFDCLRSDLTRDMPPTYLAAAEFDPLLDDSRTVAEVYAQHGQPCRLEVFPGVIHGFLHYSRMLDASSAAIDHSADYFKARHEKAEGGKGAGEE